jgi:hypothetical protein
MTDFALGTSLDNWSVADISLSPWDADCAKLWGNTAGRLLFFFVAGRVSLSKAGQCPAIVRKEAPPTELVGGIYEGLTTIGGVRRPRA